MADVSLNSSIVLYIDSNIASNENKQEPPKYKKRFSPGISLITILFKEFSSTNKTSEILHTLRNFAVHNRSHLFEF